MRAKIISFIIGCVIGGILGGIQLQAWASPIGIDEISKYQVDDPEEYMEINKIDITLEVEEACEEYGEKYNIVPEVLEAMVWRESRCKPNASNGSCRGLMQVNDKIHKSRMERLHVTDIYDVDGNINVGTDYLAELVKKNNSVAKSLDLYNGNNGGGKSSYAKQILTVAYCLDQTGGD